ncbi:MAG: hypothetical protein R2911_01440 [Caldilineaceae bacterium]
MPFQTNTQPTNKLETANLQPGPQLGDQIGLRLLVIAAQRADQNLCAMYLLDRLGVPYDTLIATETELTAERLWQDNRAHYQGVVLTTGNLLYWEPASAQWTSAFDWESWQLLWRFEARLAFGN